MELGTKIKALRLRAGMTQEMLAEELGVSFQTISKWENGVCTPDIMMLPKLSVYFGVTIDELFDLTTDQKLHRIENMLDLESELPHSTFVETIDYLQGLLEKDYNKARIYNFFAHMYYHRMASDSEKAAKYVRKGMQLRPDMENCDWILQKAEGAAICDWNSKQHNRTISFYKELIKNNPEVRRNYLRLIDNLLADNRVKEAREYLAKYQSLDGHVERQVLKYEGRIALAEHRVDVAEQKFEELKKFDKDGNAMFALADYYASQCEYDKAIHYYDISFELDKANGAKPLYTDALEAMAMIYEIQEKYEEAVKCYDRTLKVLAKEFGYTEGAPVDEVNAEKQRVLALMTK